MSLKSSLFKLDLRIDKKMVVLKVHEEDTLGDLIDRLSKAITWKNIAKDKIKTRLEDQFRKIISQSELSPRVQTKLNQLIEESKIVIVNVETTKNGPLLNETPFRILQESFSNAKKSDQKLLRKQFHYLEDAVSPANREDLKVNYQVYSNYPKEPASHNYFGNIRLKSTLNEGLHNNQENPVLQKQESSTQFFSRKYEAVDRKCNDFLRNHDQLQIKYKTGKGMYDLQKEYLPREEKRIVKNYKTTVNQYEELIRSNEERIRDNEERARDNEERVNGERVPLVANQNRLNRNYHTLEQDPDFNGDNKNGSFFAYKANRYRSQNPINRQYINLEKVQPTYTHREVNPSRSLTRINYQKQNGVPLSRDYDGLYHKGSMKAGLDSKKFHYRME